MAGVRLRGVSKTFAGNVHAVQNVSLDVEDGEFLVLVGPSGCGKSTLLRMIAGLEETTAGTIHIGERDVTRVAPRDRDVAMVFQNYALYPHMTVEDNLAFGLRRRKVPRDEVRRRVDDAARMLGLQELLRRKPAALSGGQRQRVALGRAIVRQPAVFLFDEPLSNLDALLRVDTRRELAALHRRLAATMVYVTHDQVEAMTLGARIVVVRDGVVQQIGPPLEVYERPANLFVAGFLGSPPMNLVEGRPRVEDGTVVFEALQRSWTLPSSMASAAARLVDSASTLGVRPEHVRLTSADQGQATARVEVVQPLGNETLVDLDVAGRTIVARVEPHRVPAVGDRVGLVFERDALHLFDGDGRRC